MVLHPEHLLKTCDTARPISFQNVAFPAFSVLVLGPLCCPNCLRRHVTKSEGVIPSLLCALTQVSNVLAMSERASKSATCSLGCCTEIHVHTKTKKKKYINSQVNILNCK